jgi:hypothetical protein
MTKPLPSTSSLQLHIQSMQKRLAITALAGSTYRAMPKNSRLTIVDYLAAFDLDRLRTARNEGVSKLISHMSSRLHAKLKLLAAVDSRFTSGKRSLGTQWGYAAKAVNIFLFGVALNRLLINDAEFRALLPLLHCPLDKKLFDYLKKHAAWSGVAVNLNSVNHDDYKKVQRAVGVYAESLKLAPVAIDDMSWTATI